MLRIPSRSVRASYCCSIAALLMVLGCESLQTATADGDTRTLSFHNTHTNENVTVTFKVNGRYDEEALKKINHVLRDFRENQPTTMDPHLIDLVWEVYREVEATEPIQIVCGFRSPVTNEMLRRRSNGVAKFSQHMLGKAMDFFIPGVPLEKLREVGLRAQRGGVGFYPSSNFVHMDTGSVRHWPRMPDAQLAKVIAKGPLTMVASKDRGTRVAAAPKITNPFAKLFGAAEDDDGDEAAPTTRKVAAAAPKAEPSRAEKPAAVPLPVAKPQPKLEVARAEVARVDLAKSEPGKADTKAPSGFGLASASSRPVQFAPAPGPMGQIASSAATTNAAPTTSARPNVLASANANDVINSRGFWQGLPEADSTQTSTATKAAVATPAKRPAATGDRIATGSLVPWPVAPREPAQAGSNDMLAYASPTATQPRNVTGSVAARPAQRDTTVATKRTESLPTLLSSAAPASTGPAKAGQRFNDPWMRAMIVSPSAGGFMSTSQLGAPDYRVLGPYLAKPTTSVMMTFSEDPHLGMTTAKFSGSSVVFVSTVTFYQRTALAQ
jgi:uncharacterized protein YcbK (DUF882 family)